MIPLIQFAFDPDRLESLSKIEKRGDIYDCSGMFEFDDEDDWCEEDWDEGDLDDE